MEKNETIATKYFNAFHNGELEEVFSYLSDDCTVQYGTENPVKAKIFFKESAPMIATLKFKTNGIYSSNNTNNILIDFSYSTPKSKAQDSKIIDAIDVIYFDKNNLITKIKVIPNE